MALGTAAAIAGIASTAVGTGLSFAQANSQKKAMKAADAKAAQYMADARKRLEVNYMDELAINKEPYQRQREAMLAAGAQAQQASVEGSERGSAANTGRILAAQQQAQGDIRDQMNRDMFNLEAASAEEDSRLRDINTQLDMGEISGAQQQSAQASAARQAALSQGIQGAVNTIEGAIALPDLYKKDKDARTMFGPTLSKVESKGLENGIRQDFTPIQTREYMDIGLSPIKRPVNGIRQDFTPITGEYSYNDIVRDQLSYPNQFYGTLGMPNRRNPNQMLQNDPFNIGAFSPYGINKI